MSQQPAALLVGKCDPFEVEFAISIGPSAARIGTGQLAHRVFEAIVPGERSVDEREVGVDQIEDAPVFVDDGVDEEFGFLEHRRAQGVVELREELRVGRDRFQTLKLQPLHRELIDK